MKFNQPFDTSNWKKYLQENFKDESFIVPEIISKKYDFINNLSSMGTLKLDDIDLPIYHMATKGIGQRARVQITRAAYDTIKEDIRYGSALFFITYEDKPDIYRLSYVVRDLDGKSDPKRFTYLLGKDIPTHTPETRLKPTAFTNIEDIQKAFSVEPVNSEFYQGIQENFEILVKEELKKIPQAQVQDLAIRFIGRILFCRFLAAKEFIPAKLFDDALASPKGYQEVLSPLFFDTLNTEYGQRKLLTPYEKEIPFLNGGLFSPKDYERDLPISNEFIKNFFAFLDKYNFTVDESTPHRD